MIASCDLTFSVSIMPRTMAQASETAIAPQEETDPEPAEGGMGEPAGEERYPLDDDEGAHHPAENGGEHPGQDGVPDEVVGEGGEEGGHVRGAPGAPGGA